MIDDDRVLWRDIAYQVGYEPFSLDGAAPLTISFDRRQYDGLIRSLLSQWTERITNHSSSKRAAKSDGSSAE